jgi:formate hydrogenlyase subunit 4
MAVIPSIAIQALQIVLVLVLAPFLVGLIRAVRARLLRRRGPPVLQMYLDLWRLLRKDVIVADGASWLFSATPYLVFGAVLAAAALVPTVSTDLLLARAVDLIALVALLGAARFCLALAAMDSGSALGGLGASRQMAVASLAEPALLMVALTLSLLADSSQLTTIAQSMLGSEVDARVSLALALAAIVIVALADSARMPVDEPSTLMEPAMMREALALEYSGRHLALLEAAHALKLLLYISLIACLFVPWGIARPEDGMLGVALGLGFYLAKLAVGGVLLAVFETGIARLGLFRVSELVAIALVLGFMGALLLFVGHGL